MLCYVRKISWFKFQFCAENQIKIFAKGDAQGIFFSFFCVCVRATFSKDAWREESF